LRCRLHLSKGWSDRQSSGARAPRTGELRSRPVTGIVSMAFLLCRPRTGGESRARQEPQIRDRPTVA